MNEIPRWVKQLVVFGVGSLIVIILLCSSCSVVQSGTVGAKRTLGSIHPEPLTDGAHFVWPFFQSVTMMDTKLKSFEVTSTAASKDLQVVKTVISVQHSLNSKLAPKALAEIGDLDAFDHSVVSPAVMESMKAVTAQYTAEELITKRDVVKTEISNDIQAFIDHTLDNKGISGAINIANVAIKDFQFSDEFNSSIEAKVKSQQEALKAEIVKKQAITKAEADEAVTKLNADAEAYQLEKLSIQRAMAIQRETEALGQNPNLIELRRIEKWDGKLPTTMPGNAVPFINLK